MLSEYNGSPRFDRGSGVARDARAWAVAGLLVVGMLAAAAAGFLFVSQVLFAPLPSAQDSIDSLDPKAIGFPDAPVTVLVYGDFQ